ncbi:hypothetical protein CQW23_10310 [Capsicum baccatum]|uniref:Ubiquitin-like protease family profile domain-containing protein n=1 Tax=Capsicum baccatum TaxID=33114 RepID=A0A2G2WZC1_CAPBA|nr:hypothetical protein CQW23_10310 [Capsicum baccatum]
MGAFQQNKNRKGEFLLLKAEKEVETQEEMEKIHHPEQEEAKMTVDEEQAQHTWAFEAIFYLRKQVNYQEEVSYPRFLRWLSANTDKNAKFLDLFNPPKEASVQTLSDPKVIERIKIELFGETVTTRKIILEGGFVVDDDGSGNGSGNGTSVGANDAPLTIFDTTSHYDYDHTDYIDFSSYFATSSECSACKCQDCKVKHNGVINVINVLTAFVKEITSKRGVIPSKRNLYPYTPLEIKVDVTIEATAEVHNITVDNPSNASKEEQKAGPVFNIPAGLPWYLVNKVYIPINCGDEFYWMLVVVVLKERRIRVYDSMYRRRRSGQSSEIQKLAKILPTYLDISGFLDQKVRTDWSTIEAYRNKMGNPFDIQYVEGILQQNIGSLDCGLFVVAYAEYSNDGLQVPNDGLDV